MASVVYVAGARPNFMKIAPLLRAARGTSLRSEFVHTGQHYDFEMSGVFLEQLGIPPPDVHLQVGSATHGVQTGRIMAAFEEYLLARERPRGVVVVGDVNSTMACALVAVKLGIPVAHVEAGLRSFDRTMPEEINRIVTDAISDVLLVSEPSGLDNLAREGITRDRVVYVGNVMIDSVVEHLEAARALDMPARVGVKRGGYAVVTLHRPSNVDACDRLAALVQLLVELAAHLAIVFPVHPRTEKRIHELGRHDELVRAGVRMMAPLGYREFLGLVEGARVAITDSGGIQEETTYLGVPCVTLRSSTERPITISAGTNVLVGDDLARARAVVTGLPAGAPPARPAIEGWDGRACVRAVQALLERWHAG